ATAIMYHLTDTFGLYGAPVVVFENLLIDGRRVRGPLVGNNMSHYHQEALLWGLTPDYAEPRNSYRTGLAHMLGLLEENDGDYPQIPPVMIERDQAPCKQVVLDGDDVDITAFAFIQGNPGDAGRYINTGSTFTKDPEWGQSFGTYRIQIAGPRKLLLNSEPNQTGNRMLMHAKERGERSMKIAV